MKIMAGLSHFSIRGAVSVLAVVFCSAVSAAEETERYRELKDQGDAAYFEGRYAEAESVYLRMLAVHPNDGEVYRRLGELRMATGRLEEALESLHIARDLPPVDPRVLSMIGAVYSLRGQYGEAIAMFEEALAEHPTLVSVQIDLVRAYNSVGRLNDALTLLKQLQADAPEYRFVEYSMASIHEALGDMPKAKKLYRTAAERLPEASAVVLAWLAQAAYAVGEMEEAEQALRQAIAAGNRQPLAYLLLGQIRLNAGADREALDWFYKALAINPSSKAVKAYVVRAELAVLDRMPARARAMWWARRLNVDGDEAESRQRTALYTFFSGETTEAIAELREIITQHGERPEARLRLAFILEHSHRFEEAVALYQSLLESGAWRAFAESRLEHIQKERSDIEQVSMPWAEARKVTSERVVLYTDLKPALLSVIQEEADGLVIAVGRLLEDILGEEHHPSEKLTITISARKDELMKYREPFAYSGIHRQAVGAFLPERNEVVLHYNLDSYYLSLAHEISHFVLSAGASEEILTQFYWLDEGLAEYVEMQLDPEQFWESQGRRYVRRVQEVYGRDGTPTVERGLEQGVVVEEPSEPLGIGDIIEGSPAYTWAESDRPGTAHWLGWTVVAFLLDDQEVGGQENFRRFWSLLKQGEEGMKAVQQAYGMDADELEIAWRRFLKKLGKPFPEASSIRSPQMVEAR